MKKIVLFFIVTFSFFLLVGCTKNQIKVKSFEITDKNITLNEEETKQVNFRIYPENATIKNIFWSTDNHNVAIVDKNGLLKGINQGQTTLTGETYDGKIVSKSTVNVNHVNKPVESITINGETELDLSANFDEIPIVLNIEIWPKKADNKKFTLESDKPEIVMVTKDNRIRYKGIGKAVVTAKSDDGNHVAKLNVEVLPPNFKSLTLDRKQIIGSINSKPVHARPVYNSHLVLPQELIWTSENESVAKVDKNTGLVTFIGKGKTKINVQSSLKPKLKAHLTVEVVEPIMISTAQDLLNIDLNNDFTVKNKYFMLANDIDMQSVTSIGGAAYNEGKGFKPIGFYDDNTPQTAKKLHATFDGNGYEIKNLNINRPNEYNVGLFVFIGKYGNVRNLNIIGGSISGRIVSPICGTSEGIIENCYFETEILNEPRNWNGGVVATNGSAGRVYNVISNSTLKNNKHGYAIAGRNYGYIENVFVNKDKLPEKVLKNGLVNTMVNTALLINSKALTFEELKNNNLYADFPDYLWEKLPNQLPRLKK